MILRWVVSNKKFRGWVEGITVDSTNRVSLYQTLRCPRLLFNTPSDLFIEGLPG